MSTRRVEAKPTPGSIWFLSGLACGVFATVAVWLLLTAPTIPITPDEPTTSTSSGPASEITQTANELKLDFYEMFPKSEVPVVEEYEQGAGKSTVKTVVENTTWLLQVGSFRTADEANALRASLILDGYEVLSRETRIKGQTWHRVLVGPVASRTELDRVQDRLARTDIASIRVRVTP